MKRKRTVLHLAFFARMYIFLASATCALAGTSGWLTYEIIGEAVTIIDCDHSASGSLEIPAELEGKPVTSIGNYAFDWCSSLTQISIPPGVTSISKGTFGQCSSLTNIIIPESVTSIGLGAFSLCSSLPGVNLPAGITNIEHSAFNECSSLTSITLPAGVTSIAYRTFAECTNLLSINIPSNIMDIGDSAFAYCGGLTNVTIEAGVTNIGYQAFRLCSNLTVINFPASVLSLEFQAFAPCYSLEAANFLGYAPVLGDFVFANTATNFSVYYWDEGMGFTSPTWEGYPAQLLDGDDDGMPDSWEVRHFGSIEACDPGGDPDDDNYTNLEEFRNNTNPEGFDVYTMCWPAIEIGWKSNSSSNYQIQCKTTLTNEWENIGDPIPGTDSTNSVMFTTRDADRKFYRVIHAP